MKIKIIFAIIYRVFLASMKSLSYDDVILLKKKFSSINYTMIITPVKKKFPIKK